MNKELIFNTGGNRRSGVALIIVLGLLAVMILFAISFSITSRTDRMAARSYADVVKARQLVHTAFSKVLAEHISADMNNLVYPAQDVLSRVDPNGVRLLGNQSMTSATVFVSMSLRQSAFAADPARWEPLFEYNTTNILGEYAFMVVNCSGLLDANSIGGREGDANPRQRGTSPSEIRFHADILPEVRSGAAASLNTYRSNFARFESVPELYYLTSTTVFGSMGPPPLLVNSGPLTGSMADNLHVFSRVPYGFANENLSANTNMIADISGDPSGWDVSAIEAAIADIDGAPIPEILPFIRVMQDYASEGYELAGSTDAEKFDRISSKRVPMINEVIVSNTLQYVAATTSVLHTVYITVETWYPFAEDSEADFIVTYGNSTPVDLNVQIRSPVLPASPLMGLGGPHAFSGSLPVAFSPNANSYLTHTFAFSRSVGVPGPPSVAVQFRADVVLTEPINVVYNAGGGLTVDRVNPGFPAFELRPIGGGGVSLVGGNPVLVRIAGYSANDPRINWLTSPPANSHFKDIAPSPGVSNGTLSDPQNPTDETEFMYARHAPFESVGELGYLLFDASKPWNTIRMIGGNLPPGYPVQLSKLIDRLSVRPASDYPRRGLVNPNSRQTNALAAVFWTMPVERYEGDPSATRLDDPDDDARAIAAHLITQVAKNGAITNLSDLVYRFDRSGVDPVLGTANDKFKRESLLRNSIGLLSPRHNLFTIFVAARTFVDGYNYNVNHAEATKQNSVASEQRAVAVVWRDPYTTTDSANNITHQSWVQYFHWFSGAFGD